MKRRLITAMALLTACSCAPAAPPAESPEASPRAASSAEPAPDRGEPPGAGEHGVHGQHGPHGHGPHGHGPHGHGPHGHGKGSDREYRSDHIQHDFSDAEKWSRVFDSPKRDAWQKPDAVVAAMDLEPDHLVADVGAGTGYFTIRLARAVPKGSVYAVDLEASLLAFIEKRAKEAGVSNVKTVLGSTSSAKLPMAVDRVLLVNTYHHIAGRKAYFEQLKGSLRPAGRVVVVDFKQGDLPVGPPAKHKLSADEVTAEMKSVGMQLCKSFDELEYQYVLFFGSSC